MATTKLADIYNPVTFARRTNLAQLELNKFLSSGVVVPDGRLQEQISVGGNTGELTNFNPISNAEPNYSNDDDTEFSTPNKVDSVLQRFRSTQQNNSWSTMDLARELALSDPATAITDGIGGYWATQNERRIIQSSLGILADNVANDGGDMLINLATDDVGAVDDAERISAIAVLDTKQTLGDMAGKLTAIAMHSAIFTRLQKQNLITFIPNARGEVVIPTYLNYTVVVDDSMPAVAGTNRITYTCILFGSGVFGSATGRVEHPSELARVENAGNGGGQDVLHSRRNDLFHPLGFDFTSTTVASGISATQAELALAVNWDRAWRRKDIAMAFLQVND